MVLSRRHNVYKIVRLMLDPPSISSSTSSIDNIKDGVETPLPIIAILGNSLFNNENAYLIVEKTVIGDLCPVTDILPLYFSSFYVLNIKYPAKASATMEFLQRLILNINPSGIGNRRGAARKRTKVHPKVMTLIGRLQKDESVWEVNEM
ncbi:hypothetical protein JTE90_008662 [Oedothorax gibbosus]|uniref:Uncharacterized protein n=1 Tax=Oedothorax gibbosus TaxID=931172 RepID=A0AAV6U0N9_9ARAC|nr:hypothetical protein JTE90_008662 [Oedothorax gibbosus]